ncbi:hypothetical protein [Novosphingobium sp.]|uniref:hypothetical protein n=1 Tax=Novosphingobium sp. TaxID=1874826 RepID=UPI0025D9DA05|nr:hypothetical protein [Novosphingobium sp.]
MMMPSARIGLIVGASIFATPLIAQRLTAAFPPNAILAPILQDVRDDERPRLMVPARMFRQIDLNHDGIADWVADFTKSGESGFCGTGGCRLVIYTSKPGGYATAFDEQVRQFKITSGREGMRLDLDMHGSFCGTFGALACPMSFRWDQPHGRFVEIANLQGGTRLQASVLAVADPLPPPIVTTVGAGLTQACIKLSGKTPDDRPRAVTVPDLNGDEERDWVVSAPLCPAGDDKPAIELDTVILLTSPTGLVRSAAFAPGGYAIDFATRPAQIVQLLGSDCGYGTICPERVLSWDAARRQFKTVAEHHADTNEPLERF